MSNTSHDTIEAIAFPGALFCASCGSAVHQATPAGFKPHLDAAEFHCLMSRCPAQGIKFTLPGTRITCPQVKP